MMLGTLASTAATTATAQARTRVFLLGTKGGPRVTPRARGPSAHLLLAGDVPYIIDCGYGVADKMVLAGGDIAKLRHIFLTHQHSDHNIDYGTLFLLAWASGLQTRIDTWGPPPIAKMTRLAFELNDADIAVRIEEEGRPDPRPLVVAHEFSDAGLVMQDANVRVTAARVQHGIVTPAFAYRFDTADRSIVFSGDTRKSDDVIKLAQGADVLIHEAMYLPALDAVLAKNPNAPTLREHLLAGHTTAEQAGEVAAAAGVKTLVLSHLVPGDGVSDATWEGEARKHYAGPIIVGHDMMEV
jgi:ribonuclease BN (tRNA processing enzyme)